MPLREWTPNTLYLQGDCVVIPDGTGGYMGDANGSKTWLLCCVGSGASPDSTPYGISGPAKTRAQWAALFEDPTDENLSEATVLPASVTGTRGPDGTVRWGLGIAYFVDTSAPTNGNGTYASPFNTPDSISAGQVSSQDGTNSTRQAFCRRGTTVVFGSAGCQWLGRGSSRKMEAKISDYGDHPAPPAFDCRAAVATSGILIGKSGANAARYVAVERVEEFGAGGDGISIYLGTADAAIAQDNIRITDVGAHNNGASGIQAITGGAVDRTTSSTNLTIERPRCTGNAIYGVAVREWWDGARIIEPYCRNNGRDAANGSYGVSTIGNYQTFTGADWTHLGSDVWQRVFTRTNPVVTGRIRRADGSERILNPGTFGSLTVPYTIANSGGTVQVKLGAGETPNGFPVWICYNRVKNVTIVSPRIEEQHDFRAPASRFDGDAIGIDQFSENVTVLFADTRNNGGCALIANQPKNLLVIGLVSAGDGAEKAAAGQTVAGVLINHAEGTCEVIHDAIVSGAGDGVRIYGPNAAQVSVRNNIIAQCAGVALRGTSGASAMVNQGNCLHANGSLVADATLDGTDQQADPRFVDVSSPILGVALDSPCNRAGVFVRWGLPSRSGAPFAYPPDCGPFARRQSVTVAA